MRSNNQRFWGVCFISLAIISMGARKVEADERIASEAQLLREGYRPVRYATHLASKMSFRSLETHSNQDRLPWPVLFRDEQRTIGNSMAEFQPFDNPAYFHGGCDLVTRGQSEVNATVSGRIEGGHYSYSTNPDGSMTKFFKPWPATGSDVYFEIAIVTDDGVRFEFHHIDRSRLPAKIVQLLNDWVSGRPARIEKGTVIGYPHATAFEPMQYTHVHYNVVLPDGTRVNPESISERLSDHLPPHVYAAYAITANRQAIPFGRGQFARGITEWVIYVADALDRSVYTHPPVLVTLKTSTGEKVIWDFRDRLLSQNGKFPVLGSFYLSSLQTPDHGLLRTQGGYGTGVSLIRVPAPKGLSGTFQIVLSDIAGNQSILQGQLN